MAKKSPDILLLKQGQKAPLSGALVPEYKFETMQSAFENQTLYKKELMECQAEIAECDAEVDSAQLMSAIAGAGAGGFLVWLVMTMGNALKK